MITTKKSNFLLITILSFLTLPTALAEANKNNDSYQTIVQNFSTQDKSFNDSFIPTNQDSAIIAEHKENAEKELAAYQKSWVPLFLKIVGTGFGLDAALRSASIIFIAADAPTEWGI